MSDDKTGKKSGTAGNKDKQAETGAGQSGESSSQSGPKFTEAPDPLASVRKSAKDVMASMEGKTVSMKVYVGTIIAVVVLMLLARCGT